MVTLDMNNFLFLVEVFLVIQCCESAKYCQEAVDSVKKVKSCPTSKAERDKAAHMKNCDGKALRQNCSKVDQFEYHCVINGYRNITLEVCAPTRIIFGHCVEFNVAGGVIQDQFSAPCDEHFPKCDAFYLSSTAYKYSDCYDLVLKRDIYQTTTTKDSSTANIDLWKTEFTYILIGLFGFISIVTFIIISIRRRQKQSELSKETEENITLLNRLQDIEDDNATQATSMLSKTTTPFARRSFSVNYSNDMKNAHEEFSKDIKKNLKGKHMDSTNTSEENDRLLPEKNDLEQDTLSERATTDKRRSSFCITILNSMETLTPWLRRSFSFGLTKDIEKTRSQYEEVGILEAIKTNDIEKTCSQYEGVGILEAIKNIFNWTRQPSLKPTFYFDANDQSNRNHENE